MAISKPAKVPQKNITSTDIVSFNGGLDERGDENAGPNTFTYGLNAMVNSRGLITHRFAKKKWLPNTVGTIYEVFPALYNGQLYYITADDGKLKYCKEGDLSWTLAGGSNTITTGEGIITTFIRVQDKILPMNGTDKLMYLDLSNMQVVKWTAISDPASAPTFSPTGITGTGNFKLYYAINFNSTVGQTKLSPILSQAISKQRDSWKQDGSEYATINRNNTAPAGAVSWNLWLALAPAGAVIADTDMLMLGAGIDLSVTSFVDNGAIPISIDKGTAPEDNSTSGFIPTYGREIDGRPILYGIKDSEYSIRIGGDGDNALDFSPNNGGYEVVLNKGTNYYPQAVVGFRNGQGIPSITVLFSNTQGLSKQSILEQQTVTYGNYSFVVWGVTEQNYGAAGVSSPYAVMNYNGGLYFPSTDGIMRMDTEASLQNVLAIKRISDRVEDTVSSIRNSDLKKTVGTAWANRVYFSIASRGYEFNNQILIHDLTNDDKPIWYLFDMAAQWIGTVSPQDQQAFVFICQGNEIYKLVESYIAVDENSNGTSTPFAFGARGTLMGINDAHNAFKAVVQVVFYIMNSIGPFTVGVTYRNENGRLKTKTKRVTSTKFLRSSSGGWSSPDYLFNQELETKVLKYSDVAIIESASNSQKESIRVRMPLNVIGSEFQWFVNADPEDVSLVVRSVSYEGENLGVKVDLR